MYTTLNKIRAHSPCQEGWAKLLRHLGKTEADDEPLSLLTILDSNGLDDALWCLRTVPGHGREIRLFAVWCARQVQHLMADKRSVDALDVAERYAKGLATQSELAAAEENAWDAVQDATRDAARAAAAAAWDAARDAAWAAWVAWAAWAARAAARDARDAAAQDAARAAAWDAAAQDAARAAAWEAAWDAAAQDAARAAAWEAAWDAQEKELRRRLMTPCGDCP